MKKHFTLVELWIASGCVLGLAGLTIHSADDAKQLALQWQCKSAMREGVLAMICYNQAYDGWIQLNGEDNCPWWQVPGIPEELWLTNAGDWNKPVNRPNTVCPLEIADNNVADPNLCFATPRFTNEDATDFSTVEFPETEIRKGEWYLLRCNLLTNPDTYILLTEAAIVSKVKNDDVVSIQSNSYFYRHDPANSMIYERHANEANFTYADGHIESAPDYEQLKNDSKIDYVLSNEGGIIILP